MEHEDLFGQMDRIVKEIKRIMNDNPITSDEDEIDPRIFELVAEGRRISQQLDPIMRDFYRDDPRRLAAWEEVFQMCKEIDEDNPD